MVTHNINNSIKNYCVCDFTVKKYRYTFTTMKKNKYNVIKNYNIKLYI